MFGLPGNPSSSKGPSLSGNLLGVDEFSMLQPSKKNHDGPTNPTTQQKVNKSFDKTYLCSWAFDQTFCICLFFLQLPFRMFDFQEVIISRKEGCLAFSHGYGTSK